MLVLGAGAYLLHRAGIRWAWIPTALGAAIAIRSLVRVLQAPILSVGPGLWMSAGALTIVAVWLLWIEADRVRRARGRGPGDAES